jgi:small subunit ribosomal protein S1
MNNVYKPEGYLFSTPENTEYISSVKGLEKAMRDSKIIEGMVSLCDSNMTLHIDLGEVRGIMDKEESIYCREGERLKDIAVITRVGKPICFKVLEIKETDMGMIALLSRRAAQYECLCEHIKSLVCGDIVEAKVTHLESFGAFVDIGCGISSLLSVDSISVSRISHPSDRLSVGDRISAVVKTVDEENGRIFVSTRELLGTWHENALQFDAGQTVVGIVRSVESYGVFIELAPNLAGLAEIRDNGKDEHLAKIGQYVTVYIKSIIPERMKIKLVLIDSYRGELPSKIMKYYTDTTKISHIDYWRYSPDGSKKIIESVF